MAKKVPYCHLLSSTDMVQKESEAQILVMHSNRTTFMPDKVTKKQSSLHKRQKISSKWPFIWFYTCRMSMNLTVLTLVPQVLSLMTSQKKQKTNHMHVL